MNNIEFKLDTNAFRKEVLKADWMEKAMESAAKKERKGGTHIKTFKGFDRAKAIIYPNKGNKG